VGADVVRIQLPGIRHPVYLRPGTTDSLEIHATLILKTYDHPAPREPRLIVDAGANIGDTAIWYLNRFPGAHVIAIEPDPDNFRILQMNCEPYGGRVELVHAGLWYKDTQLGLVDWRDKNSIRVTDDAPADGSGIQGVSLHSLTGSQQIDIFKCDIEGAELELFEHRPQQWLDRVETMLIDIHGDAAERSVLQAAREAGFQYRRHRELYVFRRNT
jgi:FkbM family methyltransferase